MSTHWNLDAADRLKQASETADIIKEWETKYPATPVVITGDFNTREVEQPIKTFLSESGFLDTKVVAQERGVVCNTSHLGNGIFSGTKVKSNPNHWLRGRISFNAGKVITPTSIDHIFTSATVKTLFYDTPVDDDALNASDHLPIYCDLQF